MIVVLISVVVDIEALEGVVSNVLESAVPVADLLVRMVLVLSENSFGV